MASETRCPDCGASVETTATHCPECDAAFAAPAGLEAHTPEPGLTTWEARLESWLSPEGWLGESLTTVIATVAGLCIGPLVFGFLAIVTGRLTVAAGMGLVAWLGTTLYLIRHPTVYGAVHNGGVAVAGSFVVFPLSILIGWGGSAFDRFVGFLAFELVFGSLAVSVFFLAKTAGQIRKKTEV